MIGAPFLSIYPGLDAEMLPLALIIVILGGSGSLLGAFVGSFIIGFLFNFGQALFPNLAYVILFLPMVLILVLRPQGLFGKLARMTSFPPPAASGSSLGLLVLATLPVWMQHPYYINTSSQILYWAIIALGLNVLVGYAGLTSLGHAGLFAITGYAVALMVDAGCGHLTGGARRDRADARRRGRVRGAGAARDRHRLPDDHAGAGPDRVGHRLSLGRPHQRRQRRQPEDAADAVRLRPVEPIGVLLGDVRDVRCSRSSRMHLFVRSPFGASRARHPRPDRAA